MGKRHIAAWAAGRVRIRLLEESDLPRTLAWRNQEHIRRWFFSSGALTAEQHAAWFSRYRDRDDDFVFVIEYLGETWLGGRLTVSGEERGTVPPTQSGRFSDEIQAWPPRPVGQVALYNIDWSAGRAEFGRLMIGESDATGRGLAREATKALLDLAAIRLGLREVYLDVISGNVRAIKAYEACGFTVIGHTARVISMKKRLRAGDLPGSKKEDETSRGEYARDGFVVGKPTATIK